MSTDFHRLNPPVTSLRVTEGPASHDRVKVWVGHALAGELVVNAGQGRRMALIYTRADRAVTRVGIGDGKVGLIIADQAPDEDEQLVSDYGDVTTLRELREAANVVRIVWRSEVAP